MNSDSDANLLKLLDILDEYGCLLSATIMTTNTLFASLCMSILACAIMPLMNSGIDGIDTRVNLFNTVGYCNRVCQNGAL